MISCKTRQDIVADIDIRFRKAGCCSRQAEKILNNLYASLDKSDDEFNMALDIAKQHLGEKKSLNKRMANARRGARRGWL